MSITVKEIRYCLASVFLAPLLLGLSGCLIGADSSQTRTGNYVAESTFAQIEPGKTTEGWVKATLGEPTTRAAADDTVVWSYKYTEKYDSSGAVFLIFGAHNSSETTHTAFVEIKDGVVLKKWRG